MTAYTEKAGRQVAVVGGGFTGLAAAYTLRRRLEPQDRVVLIDPKGFFVFLPSMVWAALGRGLGRSAFPLEPALASHDIRYIKSAVHEVRPAEHVLVTDEGELSYDKLLIATGGRPDSNAVPGLAGEFRSAYWIVGEESAMDLRNMLRSFYKDPGPIVIGAAEGAGYLSAVYEIALSLDAELRRRDLRERMTITFLTPEPYLGHLGFGQTAAHPTLEKLFEERGIEYRTGVCIERVTDRSVILNTADHEEVRGRLRIIMPPFTGSIGIWKSAGLTDRHGLIPVDEQYRHTATPDVYAAGVGSYFAHPVHPLPTGHVPQTAYLSTRMGKAAAENIAASLGAGSPASRPLPALLDVRVIDGKSAGLLLYSRGKSALHNRAIRLPGRIAHMLKSGIEWIIIRRLRHGTI